MYKKLFKPISLSLMALLLLGFTFFFVGCKNKNENTNNAPPPLADSIPDSNVYDDITQYVKTHGELKGTTYILFIKGNFDGVINGNGTSTKVIMVQYDTKQNNLHLFSSEIDSSGSYIRSMSLNLSQYIDDSKTERTIGLQYSTTSITPGETIGGGNDTIIVPATKYVDLNTTTKLTDVATFDKSVPYSDEQKTKILTHVSPIVSEGLTEFSNFYANTIKNNNKYLGATYKYFYLPVIK